MTENPQQPKAANASLGASPKASVREPAHARQPSDQSPPTRRASRRSESLTRADVDAELRRRHDQLRDYEKALVERIADVDDDRRAMATRLQRAWQTQRQELDERLGRHLGVVGGVLLVVMALFAAALFLVYRQASDGYVRVAGEVDALRQELELARSGGGVTERIHLELAGLTVEAGEFATALQGPDTASKARVDPQLPKPPDVPALAQAPGAAATSEIAAPPETPEVREIPAMAASPMPQGVSDSPRTAEFSETSVVAESLALEEVTLAAQIQQLEAEQGRLLAELGSLQSGLDTALPEQSAAVAAPDEPAVGAIPEAGESHRAGPASSVPDEASAPLNDPQQTRASDGLDAVSPPETRASPAAVAERPQEQPQVGVFGPQETLLAPAGSYALQLIGFSSQRSRDRFVARDDLPPRIYSVRQTHKGRPWHAVIHSLHGDLVAAKKAHSELPEDLRALSPWIRPLSAGTELRILETGSQPHQQAEANHE